MNSNFKQLNSLIFNNYRKNNMKSKKKINLKIKSKNNIRKLLITM